MAFCKKLFYTYNNMARFTVAPGAQKLGAKLPDGTVYLPNQRGSITVENPKHVAQLRRPNAASNLGLLHETVVAAGGGADRYCPQCVFNNQDWVAVCTRCGAPLE